MEHEQSTLRNSQSAWTLHTRLQTATRHARAAEAARVETPHIKEERRPRLTAAAPWALLETFQSSAAAIDVSLSQDRAVRRVLAGLLNDDRPADAACDLSEIAGRILIIRSGPWPVLRTLLDALAAQAHAACVSVLCHKRDAETLADMAQKTGLALEPVFYPRFEPFVTTTLRRLLTGGPWTCTFVLDASKHGRGHALEHVTSAVTCRTRYVWNESGQAFRQRSLRERLGPEKYALVRGLLRWHATGR